MFHIRARLFFGKALLYHHRDTHVDQFIHIAVSIAAVGITPLTVRFVERAVLLMADDAVLKRHPAALTDQLLRRAEQGVDRNAKEL